MDSIKFSDKSKDYVQKFTKFPRKAVLLFIKFQQLPPKLSAILDSIYIKNIYELKT
jgi:hypothetical protein